MKEVSVSDASLRQAAQEGMDAFVDVFVNAIREAIGGELTAETMAELSADQITLLAYDMLREEVMDGGFVQLIHNGYGPFFFRNPFDKAVRNWGIPELCSLIRKAHKLYNQYREELEADCSDEEFMAMFERYPAFDDLDDVFVENEEDWTALVATYIDEHIENFATVTEPSEQ